MNTHPASRTTALNHHRGRTLLRARSRHDRPSPANAWIALEQLEPRAFLTVIAAPDLYTAAENTPLAVDGAALSKVLANDTAGTNLPNIASLLTPPEYGTLTLNPNGTFNYMPSPNFSGTDSFSYIARYNPDPVTIIHPDNHPWSIFHPTDGVNPIVSDPDFNTTWFLPEGDPLVPPFPGSGTGLMGYGGFDGDDPTTEMVQPASGRRFTAYFRTTFDFTSDPAMMTDLFADVSIDDGAFIYLNGSLLTTWRIAEGTLDTFTARGLQQDDEAPETIDLIARVPDIASLLIQGTNTLAISIHNENITNSDLFLKLGLRANFNEESDPTPVTLQVQNANQPPVGVPDFYTVLEGGLLNVQPAQGLAANDGELAIDQGHILDILPPANLPSDAIFSADVATGTFTLDLNGASDFHGDITFNYILSDIHGQSAPIPVTINVISVDDPPVAFDDPMTPGLFTTAQGTTYHSAPLIQLLPLGAQWRALNITTGIDPAIADTDFNTTWYTNTGAYNGPAFSALSPAPFHGGGVTGLTGGTVLEVPPSGSRYTSYYTTTFEFNGDPADILRLYSELLVDDGAVIYLNGAHVARFHFPTSGSDTFKSQATTSISSETTYWEIPLANALVTGLNFLAISVHNSDRFDGDFGFDLNLNAYLAGGYNLLANDTDSDTPPANLTTRRGANPQYGSYFNPINGHFSYIPHPNFFGTDSFTYFAFDGVSSSLLPATVTVQVLDGRLPPILSDRITNATDYDVLEDTPLDTRTMGMAGSLYTRDKLLDAGGEPFDPIFNAIIDDAALNGRLEFDISTGHFTFTPEPEYSGQTFFTYALIDKDGVSNTATVRINVVDFNDPPMAADDHFNVVRDASLTVNAESLVFPRFSTWLYEDSAIDLHTAAPDWNQPGFDPQAPSGGPVWKTGVGEFGLGDPVDTYLNFLYQPTFYFRKDFTLTSDQVADFTSLHLNLLRDDGAVVYINGVEALRSNMPSGPINFNTLATSAAFAPDEFTHLPFTIDLTDPALFPGGNPLKPGENVVAVELHQVNTTSEDAHFDIEMLLLDPDLGLLANDSDVEGSAITASLLTPPQFGTATISERGSFIYTPNPGYIGPDSFTYRAADNAGAFTISTVHINVLAPGDLNADHLLSAADIDALFAHIRQGLPFNALFDLNADGAINQADVQLLISSPALLNTVPGDANLDGATSLGDLVILATNFNQPGGWAMGDFTGDAMITLGDLVILAENFDQSHSEPLTADTPAAANLVALDALGLIGTGGSDDDEDSDNAPNSPADILAELGQELRG